MPGIWCPLAPCTPPHPPGSPCSQEGEEEGVDFFSFFIVFDLCAPTRRLPAPTVAKMARSHVSGIFRSWTSLCVAALGTLGRGGG